MKSAFLFLLFLSLTAVSLGAPADQRNESLSITDIIAKINENINSSLLQDDIMASAKNAVPCTSVDCKWRKSSRFVNVPYEISSSFSLSQRNTIISALETFHRSTCIRFIQRTFQFDHVYFFSGDGCYAQLGRQGGRQEVSLMSDACLRTGIIQHEALHALGFHHEQVRSDRDEYVRILFENIVPGEEHNFDILETNNLGTPYNYSSVMHYSKFTFSKNGEPTIVALSDPDRNLGGFLMNSNDIDRVNRLYRCCLNETCPSSSGFYSPSVFFRVILVFSLAFSCFLQTFIFIL